MVDAIAAPVEPILGAITALIEPLLDAIAAAIGSFAVLRPNLRGAHEEPQTEPYCTAFHLQPP
jgi:hypothetical protein